jgi:hypothetical protein
MNTRVQGVPLSNFENFLASTLRQTNLLRLWTTMDPLRSVFLRNITTGRDITGGFCPGAGFPSCRKSIYRVSEDNFRGSACVSEWMLISVKKKDGGLVFHNLNGCIRAINLNKENKQMNKKHFLKRNSSFYHRQSFRSIYTWQVGSCGVR